MKFALNTLFFGLVFCACTTNTQPYESVEKNQKFREVVAQEENGEYVLLSKGYTYFEEANPDSSEGTVVLVHGFSVPSYIWEVTFNTLKEKGYRVVMMDLFGRGNSDNPDLPQTDALRAQQVLDLMNALGIEKAILAGLSNGGRIISKMAAMDASKIEALFYVSSSSFLDYEKQTDTTVSPWGGDFEKVIELLNNESIGEENIRFFLGYSGWGENQLQNEIELNSWIIQENCIGNKVININSESFWRKQIRSLGGAYLIWGNAPKNPSHN